MPADPLDASGSDSLSLTRLLADLHDARGEVGRLRERPVSPDRLSAAHETLLVAMESYTAALTARGLPTPWRPRDDLRLERGLEAHRLNPRR